MRRRLRSTVVLLASIGMAGCVVPGYQFAQPPGFSSTYQRYLMDRQQVQMQGVAAKMSPGATQAASPALPHNAAASNDAVSNAAASQFAASRKIAASR